MTSAKDIFHQTAAARAALEQDERTAWARLLAPVGLDVRDVTILPGDAETDIVLYCRVPAMTRQAEPSAPAAIEPPALPEFPTLPVAPTTAAAPPIVPALPAAPALPLEMPRSAPNVSAAPTIEPFPIPTVAAPAPSMADPLFSEAAVRDLLEQADPALVPPPAFPPLPMPQVEPLMRPMVIPTIPAEPAPTDMVPVWPAAPTPEPPMRLPIPEHRSVPIATTPPPAPLSEARNVSSEAVFGLTEDDRAAARVGPTPPPRFENPFLVQQLTPLAQAERAAASIISDVVAYSRDAHQKAVNSGVAAIQERYSAEISKAWQLYHTMLTEKNIVDQLSESQVQRVFVTQVNEILGLGQDVLQPVAD